MPKLRSETIGTGDMSWLDSTHGIVNARTVTIDISTFTAGTHYPNGYIPAGTPLTKASGLAAPYTSAEATTTGAGVLWGHLLFDAIVNGTDDFPAAMISHGRINTAKVPQGTDTPFTAPVSALKRVNTTIDYV